MINLKRLKKICEKNTLNLKPKFLLHYCIKFLQITKQKHFYFNFAKNIVSCKKLLFSQSLFQNFSSKNLRCYLRENFNFYIVLFGNV